MKYLKKCLAKYILQGFYHHHLVLEKIMFFLSEPLVEPNMTKKHSYEIIKL